VVLGVPSHAVELVISSLFGLGGVAGYHSSVLVDGVEYFFDHAGIVCSEGAASHSSFSDTRRIEVGTSSMSGSDMEVFLSRHFKPNTYDVLHKNCNSFTHCALHFLCKRGLDLKFRFLENVGRAMDESIKLVRGLPLGYEPNPLALDFNTEDVTSAVDDAAKQRGPPRSEGSAFIKDTRKRMRL